MPQQYPQRNQLKHTRKRYRVRNWSEYESGLRRRGDLTIWFSSEALARWQPSTKRKAGGQQRYSDTAIEAALTVRLVYGLALRQTEGFLRSIADLLQLDIEIPDHSTMSRRSQHLRVPSMRNANNTEGPVHILIDSTGLSVHRGRTAPEDSRNRRMWRKLHLVVDAETAEILSAKITTHDTRDSTPVSALLDSVDRSFASVGADGAYDRASVYKAIANHSPKPAMPIRVLIPPGRNARLSENFGVSSAQRDKNIRDIERLGRRKWQQESGYNRRSLVETAMFRFKNQFGNKMRSRTMQTQITDAKIACSVLNTMTRLGMPDGHCMA